MNYTIDGKVINEKNKPFIIAELSGNHNGSIDRAITLINEAKIAGVDAVKLQTYTPDTITLNHDAPQFRLNGGIWDGKTLYELYQETYTPWEWHETLFNHAKKIGLTIFSSPFDTTAVDLLESLDTPAYKIASFEIIDLPLIEYIAKKNKPLIISTGMANIAEIDEACRTVYGSGNSQIALLHCTSGYPTPLNESDLLTIQHLQNTFNVPVGLSDHTEGTLAPIVAVALGARIIEKHFTLDRSDGGPDSKFSLNPAELKQLVIDTHNAYNTLGTANYSVKPSEGNGVDYRRSLYIVEDILEGDKFTSKNIKSIRPGGGLYPKYLPNIIGKQSTKNLKKGDPVEWSMIC